jgi:NAD(P)H-flavin reductase
MTIALPEQLGLTVNATLIEKQRLAPDIMRLRVQSQTELAYFAGQFINLQRDDGLTRSYSIANRPNSGQVLEFHIRRLPQGQFSNWVHDVLEIGDNLKLSSAQGHCYYFPQNSGQPLLLIATGTGLAPLYGIILDALHQGHTGNIELFHGSRNPDGLYLVEELQSLSEQYPNFHYTACLSAEHEGVDYTLGRAHEVAFADKKNLKGWRVYLCGHPEMVRDGQKTAYIKGASLKDIYTDAFVVGK